MGGKLWVSSLPGLARHRRHALSRPRQYPPLLLLPQASTADLFEQWDAHVRYSRAGKAASTGGPLPAGPVAAVAEAEGEEAGGHQALLLESSRSSELLSDPREQLGWRARLRCGRRRLREVQQEDCVFRPASQH